MAARGHSAAVAQSGCLELGDAQRTAGRYWQQHLDGSARIGRSRSAAASRVKCVPFNRAGLRAQVRHAHIHDWPKLDTPVTRQTTATDQNCTYILRVGERKWPERLALGYMLAATLSIYVLAANPDWSEGVRAAIVCSAPVPVAVVIGGCRTCRSSRVALAATLEPSSVKLRVAVPSLDLDPALVKRPSESA